MRAVRHPTHRLHIARRDAHQVRVAADEVAADDVLSADDRAQRAGLRTPGRVFHRRHQDRVAVFVGGQRMHEADVRLQRADHADRCATPCGVVDERVVGRVVARHRRAAQRVRGHEGQALRRCGQALGQRQKAPVLESHLAAGLRLLDLRQRPGVVPAHGAITSGDDTLDQPRSDKVGSMPAADARHDQRELERLAAKQPLQRARDGARLRRQMQGHAGPHAAEQRRIQFFQLAHHEAPLVGNGARRAAHTAAHTAAHLMPVSEDSSSMFRSVQLSTPCASSRSICASSKCSTSVSTSRVCWPSRGAPLVPSVGVVTSRHGEP